MENKFVVSMSPHIHEKEGISGIMLDVIIALIPAAVAGIYYFGYRAAMVMLTTIAASVLSEYLYEKAMKRKVTVKDLSAVVTGLLLALNLPSTIPLWMAAIGSVFAIVIVKQLYGGIGRNFMNPALAARCFMLIAWAGAMNKFAQPLAADVISSATPLAVMKGMSEGATPALRDAFWGNVPGSIGETSVFAILIGFVYLLARRVISWKIPVTYVVVFGVLTYFFGNNTTAGADAVTYTLLQVCSGGLVLGAVFMATDYTTTPTTPWGLIIFGAGCGIITFVLRKFGSYPDGVSFAILLMNILTPQIDKFTTPRRFGEVRKNA